MEAKLGDLANEPFDLLVCGCGAEVICAEVVVGDSISEHVIDGGEDRGCDGANGFLGTTAMSQALELGLQITSLLAAGGPGALHQGCLEPGRSFADAD